MLLIRLETKEGSLITHLEMPPFNPLPVVVVWGIRTFVLRPLPATLIPTYLEGFAYVIAG